MDVSQYLEIFLDETNEHLQSLNTQILALEQDPENIFFISAKQGTDIKLPYPVHIAGFPDKRVIQENLRRRVQALKTQEYF